MIAEVIKELSILLFFACGIGIFADKIKQPYTIALVLAGLAISFLHITPHIYISHDVIFYIILPPLLFYGAMHMDLGALRRNWRSVALLAIPGVIGSTLIIGYLLHVLIGLPLMYAMLFGALITPTDPISVLAILDNVGAPKRLKLIIEGESLFNDGTGVVLFALILGIITGGEQFHLGESAWEFLKVTGGGTLIGVAVGLIAFKVFKSVDDAMHEVLITIVVTFGTPVLAEALHFSGIIALVIAGLIVGNYGTVYSMSDRTRNTLNKFWEVIDFVVNSVLFMIIGVELQIIGVAKIPEFIAMILVTILVVLAARAVVVYPIVALKKYFLGYETPWRWAHVLFWGGLKGSISIALVVGLPPDIPYRSTFLILAFSYVLFSLVLQGLTMKPLIRYLKMSYHA